MCTNFRSAAKTVPDTPLLFSNPRPAPSTSTRRFRPEGLHTSASKRNIRRRSSENSVPGASSSPGKIFDSANCEYPDKSACSRKKQGCSKTTNTAVVGTVEGQKHHDLVDSAGCKRSGRRQSWATIDETALSAHLVARRTPDLRGVPEALRNKSLPTPNLFSPPSEAESQGRLALLPCCAFNGLTSRPRLCACSSKQCCAQVCAHANSCGFQRPGSAELYPQMRQVGPDLG